MIVSYLFYDCELFVILGDYVILDVGIGLVYIVLGYGEDDYIAGSKYKLFVVLFVDLKGLFIEEVFGFEGIFYDKVNLMIIDLLKEKGVLLKLDFFIYSYFYDWWMKKFVIYCVIL